MRNRDIFVSKKTKMYSSEDLEKFYFDYQTEWMPRGMSIYAYCSRNNVPYKILDRWIKGIYKRVVSVEVLVSDTYKEYLPALTR